MLSKYKRVWVDATTFCCKPLDEWIHHYDEQFFAFQRLDMYPISNWFLYNGNHSYIAKTLADAFNTYWMNRVTADNYFIFHLIFKRLYNIDVTFKQEWDKVIKISADIPHRLKYNGHRTNVPMHIQNEIDTRAAPLYKLEHHNNASSYLTSSKCNVFYYLVHSHGLI